MCRAPELGELGGSRSGQKNIRGCVLEHGINAEAYLVRSFTGFNCVYGIRASNQYMHILDKHGASSGLCFGFVVCFVFVVGFLSVGDLFCWFCFVGFRVCVFGCFFCGCLENHNILFNKIR